MSATKPTFTAEFFKGNRKSLVRVSKSSGPIVLTANGLMQRSADSTFPFRQDGSFWYLTGIDEPNIILVIDGEQEYLIVPERSSSREAFDGTLDIQALRRVSGIKKVLVGTDGWKRLGVSLKKSKDVSVISPAKGFIEQIGMYTNPARRKLIKDIKNVNPGIKFSDLRPRIYELRMVKQAEELRAIQKAVDVTTAAMNLIRARYKVHDYDNEADIEIELTREFLRGGATDHSFPPIIAAGSKSTQIHPVGNKGVIANNDSLLMDVGAEYDHYTADLTRTWATSPTKRFQAVHSSVLEVQDFAFSLLKPGVILHEYEDKIERFMGEKLKALGLINKVEQTTVRRYYPHTTSHFLGIDVHDAGNPELPLVPGVVLTVEPGIYIPEEGIGIRIEDNIVVTETGYKLLSAKLQRTL